jgi:hypothetical protein
MKRDFGVKLWIAALVAAGFTITLLAFFPGYMPNDATYVYAYGQDWSFGDWQSPLMSIVWRLIDPVAPGPGSMFLLIAALYWLGFGLLALTVARRSAGLGLIVPLLALAPPAFLMLVMLWRDMLFGVLWLLAAVIANAVAERRSPLRLPLQALALVLIGFGVLLRPNAIAAAPLLAVFAAWPNRFDWRRAVLLLLPGLVAGYALLHVVYYEILDVKRENPLHSLLVFDLGGITHFSGENQFPVTWTPQQTALLTSQCYNPDRWDSYWTLEPCKFVMQRLERSDDVIFGTSRLSQAWLHAVTAHPLAYLQHRATVMWHFLADPNLTLELYHADDPAVTPLARNGFFKSLMTVHDALKTTVLFRMGFWLILAIAVCVFAWPARLTAAGAFAVGVTSSAIIYVMSYCALGVAADFRYGYWCVLATLCGAVTAFSARRLPASASGSPGAAEKSRPTPAPRSR